MASWYENYNPFNANANLDQNLNDTLTAQGPSFTGAKAGEDWFNQQRDAAGATLENTNQYHQRLGQYLSDHLGGQGYYTDSQSQQNLGANIATLVELARLKAGADGNIGSAANPDTVRNYLKQDLKNYLTTGNLATATGVGGVGNPNGQSYKDLYGNYATNAANASANTGKDNSVAANWYSNNAFGALSGLKSALDLQTGGGLNSAEGNVVTDLQNKANAQNGNFWQDPNGGVYNPWGGSFSSNLQFPTPQTGTGGTGGTGGSTDTGTGGTPPVTGTTGGTPPQTPAMTPPPAPYTWTGPGTDPNTPAQPQPVAYPGSPDMTTVSTSLSADPMTQLTNTLTPVWSRLFGRAPTYNEMLQWQGRLNDRYGGDLNAMIADLTNSAPARQYQATGRAAPVVANGQDTGGANQYFDWLNPGGDRDQWIQNFLGNYGARR